MKFKNEVLDPTLNTFDYFIDDLLSSDINLLNGELDFLIIQHLLNSIDLDVVEKTELNDKDILVA